jgi:prepilin-type N-terminal cleavage/methylation domain-containing protein
MRDRRGFTLIEITIAVMILGIMVVIATTNLQLWQRHYSVVGFQREVLSLINQARTRSMASSFQHRLRIVNAETVVLEQGNAGTASGTWVNAAPQVVGTKGAGIHEILCNPLPASVIPPATFAFIFNPDGQVLTQDNAATVRALTDAKVRLSAGSTVDQATIRVYGWTSKARLDNGWP